MKNFTGGWFVGNFIPSVHKTKDFEACYKIHKKGEKWDAHYHKVAIEINYLIRGRMKIQDQILKKGDIFVLNPKEVADPTFFEDCELIVIKIPSIKGDKYNLNKKI